MKEKKSQGFIETGAKKQELGCTGHPLCLGVVSRLRSQVISGTNKRLFTIKEAARYLGRSPWTVAEMIRSGRLSYIPDGKRRFLDIHDLNDWIEKSKRRDLD